MKFWLPIFMLLPLTLLSACSTSPVAVQDSAPHQFDHTKVKPMEPKYEPKSQYGNPKEYQVNGQQYQVLPQADGYKAEGIASWYGTKFHGQRTSSGELYDLNQLTAAHRSLPIPTYARVTNLDNGRSIVVKVNDRGPFHENRIIDLSYAAAHELGFASIGTAFVKVETLTDTKQAHLTSPGTPKQYLQVGAFSNQVRAQAFANQIKAHTEYHIGLYPVKKQHTQLTRVRIGPISEAAALHQLQEKLAQMDIASSLVVVE